MKRHQLFLAVTLGIGLNLMAIVIGNYFQVGVEYPLFFKIIHVGAGFALAMFFDAFSFSWKAVYLGVFAVSTLYETYEHILILPAVNSYVHSWIPWFSLPNPSIQESILDYLLNFAGVAIFYMWTVVVDPIK